MFPDSEARVLGTAIDRLTGELEHVLAVHREAHASDLDDLRGPHRDRLEQGLRVQLARVRDHRQALAAQRAQLRVAVAAAQVEVARRQAERRRWQRAGPSGPGPAVASP